MCIIFLKIKLISRKAEVNKIILIIKLINNIVKAHKDVSIFSEVDERTQEVPKTMTRLPKNNLAK